MRLMTWNINSVRLRLPLLVDVLNRMQPDIFCLQETKTPDEFFPVDALVDKGYAHYHFAGMKGYNGVCIFSKYPLSDKEIHKRCGKNDMRHISARVKAPGKAFELHNIYIPAGGYEPDVEINDKFRHKLDFVDELTDWFGQTRTSKTPMISVGDFNIAPLEHDVWDSKKMQKVVSHTPVEREKFARFFGGLGWTDAVRHFVPEDKKLYSWWSYRAADWDAADKGRRLDHVWVTKPLSGQLKNQQVLREARGWQQPSDHVPVIVDMDMST